MSKLLGPTMSYPTIIDAYLTEKLQKEAEAVRKWNPLRPSSAGKCARELAFERWEYVTGEKLGLEPIKPDLHRTFRLGHSVEYNMIRDMEEVEIFQVKYKQQMLEFFKIGEELFEGSTDFVLYLKNHRAVGDVKSKKDKFVAKWFTDWDAMNERLGKMESVQQIDERGFWVEELEQFLNELEDPWFSSNFIQLNLYACSQFLQDRGVDHAFILQLNKNDSRIREIRFKPSMKVFEGTRAKFESIIKAVDGDKNPYSVTCEFPDSTCLRRKYCPLKPLGLCGDGDGTKKRKKRS